MDFHTISTCFFSSLGGSNEIFDELFDLSFFQSTHPCMEDLREEQCTMFMHGVGSSSPTSCVLIIKDAPFTSPTLANLLHVRCTRGDNAKPTFGATRQPLQLGVAQCSVCIRGPVRECCHCERILGLLAALELNSFGAFTGLWLRVNRILD